VRRCPKHIAVIGIAGDLFKNEVIVHGRSIKNYVPEDGSNLRKTDDVFLKVAEHLVGLTRNSVTGDAICLAKEEQRTILLIISHRLSLAAGKSIDGRVG